MVARFEDGWDVDGPVQAEIFVVWRAGDHLELTGPCGADPWYVEIADGEHPVEVVTRMATELIGAPRLVHSTSWRTRNGGVTLTFVVVIEAGQLGSMASTPIARAELARSEARAAPRDVGDAQVIEHGLRHLAWLAVDDPVVRRELDQGWAAVLAAYTPEPFRNLG
jgi:hypothetical protein